MLDVADALVGVGIIINSDSMPGVLMLDKDYNNMSKFLNRILGMPVELQNRLFKYFTDTLQAIISQAKKSGRFDLGILGIQSVIYFYFNTKVEVIIYTCFEYCKMYLLMISEIHCYNWLCLITSA